MKVFRCSNCQQQAFFENTECLTCGHLLAYLPDKQRVVALETIKRNLWNVAASNFKGDAVEAYKLCLNYQNENICNWAIPETDINDLCESCRLTTVIPNMSKGKNKEAWVKLESAKRCLLYSFAYLNFPTGHEGEGLRFKFLADEDAPAGKKVLTGHAKGVITLNIAEADDAEREKRRLELGEPYRTLLGHFRHESGHYAWDVLIKDTPLLAEFRNLFGDDRNDYTAALQKHYQTPVQNWQEQFISSYASAHPWEDWAETWAHYLHMTDTLETAQSRGIELQKDLLATKKQDALEYQDLVFEDLVSNWFNLTYVLNNLNRSLGLADAYPFLLTKAVLAKLGFVHKVLGVNYATAQAA